MILEIGCRLRRINNDNIGVDLRRSNLIDVQADVHFLPFRKKVFTRTIMFEVLEHLVSPERALIEISRVTNGDLMLSIPNIFYFGRIVRHLLRTKSETSYDHSNAWGQAEIINVLAKANFQVVEFRFFNTHYHTPRGFKKLLDFLIPNHLSKHSLFIYAQNNVGII